MFRGEHINFLARLTLGQPAVCPRGIWTLTRAKSLCLCVVWIQEGFTAEPPRNDSGADFQGNDSGFSPKVRVTSQKSELQAKSRSYSGAEPQNPNRIAQKRSPNQVEALLQKTPLKAFLNPANLCASFLLEITGNRNR